MSQQGDLPRLPARAADSHKGDYGRLLLIGGSRGMSGAIALSGMAALRAGAGLVTLAVPDCCVETVAAFEPCAMTTPLPCDPHGGLAESAVDAGLQLAARADVVACGPGLGHGIGVRKLVPELFACVDRPLVVDADGLNALAEHAVTQATELSPPPAPRVLTPHPGEFRRLCPAAAEQTADMHLVAVEWTRKLGVVLVLKGHRTFITDGRRWVQNTTGNPGMATAGAGDVLTGILAALLAQGLDAWEAARLAVHVHGLAGDLAAVARTQIALVARDLVEFLPAAWQQLGYSPRSGDPRSCDLGQGRA
jgi:NAD(P)H-hydrate epimerase